MDTETAEMVRAAGCILKAPSGRVLLMHRTDGEGWAWPAGGLKDGETPEQGAWREVFEETGRRLGDVGAQLMRSTKNGVDFVTFICPVDDEFVPRMNHEHDSYMWADPEAVLEQAKAANGSGSMAMADSAELETPPMLNNSGDEIEDGLDAPADPEDDIPDDLADLILAELETIEARLTAIEDCRSDDDDQPNAEPVHGAGGAAELEQALDETVSADWDEEPVERDDRKAAQQVGRRFRSRVF